MMDKQQNPGIPRRTFLRAAGVAGAAAWASAAVSAQETPRRPAIRKLGTIDLDLVETTPVVVKWMVYSLE